MPALFAPAGGQVGQRGREDLVDRDAFRFLEVAEGRGGREGA